MTMLEPEPPARAVGQGLGSIDNSPARFHRSLVLFGAHYQDGDVTEQIEAEQALRELNETLEQRVEDETRKRLHLWNVSEDLLVVMDMEGKYLSVNPAWTATLGWSALDLLGRTSQWGLHADDQEKTRAEIRHLAVGRKTLRFENRFRHRDGSYRWISWKAVPDGAHLCDGARRHGTQDGRESIAGSGAGTCAGCPAHNASGDDGFDCT